MPTSLQDLASATPGFANNLDSSSSVSERLSPTLSLLALTASSSPSSADSELFFLRVLEMGLSPVLGAAQVATVLP